MGCTHREGDGVCFDCRDGDELQRLAAENASLREAGRQVEAELERLRGVLAAIRDATLVCTKKKGGYIDCETSFDFVERLQSMAAAGIAQDRGEGA